MIRTQLIKTIAALAELKLPAHTIHQMIRLKYIELLETELNGLNRQDVSADEWRQFFQKIWLLTRHSFLSYTASPNEPLTLILLDLAIVLAKELRENPLTLIMPGVATESTSDEYPDLHPEPSLNAMVVILNQYIVSDNFNYLIPLTLICAQSLTAEPQKKFTNPYYCYQTMNEHSLYLTEDEINRLEQHSSDISALMALRKQYVHLISHDQTLLSELFCLLEKLYLNGAHGGIGQQDNAGEDAYLAIIHFNSFYELLSDELKSIIPENVHKELELLIQLSSDPSINSDATINLETCIASRRDKLMNLVKTNELTLAKIGIQDEAQKQLMDDISDKYQTLQKRILEEITQYRYLSGREDLSLTKTLMDAFQMDVTFESKQEFEMLLELPAKDIALICDSRDLSAVFLSHFYTLDDLMFYVVTAEASRLKVVLSQFSRLFTNAFFIETSHFAHFVSVLSDKQLQIVMQAFNPHLMDIIPDGQHLHFILQFLPSWYRDMFIRAILPSIPAIITKAYELQWLLPLLSMTSFQMLYPSVESLINELITDAHQFNRVSVMFTASQLRQCYELNKLVLKNSIVDLLDVQLILEHFDENLRADFFIFMQDKWPSLVKDASQWFKLLNISSSVEREYLFHKFAEELENFIISSEDFLACLLFFSPEYRERLCMQFSEKLPNLIRDYLYLGHILNLLNQSTQIKLLKTLKPYLPIMVNTPKRFSTVSRYLFEDTNSWFFNCFLVFLEKMIQQPDDLIAVISSLNDKNIERLLIKIDVKLPRIIQQFSQLKSVVDLLSPANTNLLLILMKGHIKTLINSGYYFNLLIRDSDFEKVGLIFNVMCCLLPEIIWNINDFFVAIENLNQEQKQFALYSSLFKLLDYVEDARDFSHLLQAVEADDFNFMLTHLATKPNVFMRNFDDLKCILSHASEKQRHDLYLVFNQKIVELTSKVSDFCCLSPLLDQQQTDDLFKKTMHIVSENIVNKNQLGKLLQVLSPEQAQQFVETLEGRIDKLIVKPSEFKMIAYYLPYDYRQHLFQILRKHLLLNTHNFFQVNQFLSLLLPQERFEQFSSILQIIPSCINNQLDGQLFFEILAPVEIAQALKLFVIRQKIACIIVDQAQFEQLAQLYDAKMSKHMEKPFSHLFLDGMMLGLRSKLVCSHIPIMVMPQMIKLYYQCQYAITRKDRASLVGIITETIDELAEHSSLKAYLEQMKLAVDMAFPHSISPILNNNAFFKESASTATTSYHPDLR